MDLALQIIYLTVILGQEEHKPVVTAGGTNTPLLVNAFGKCSCLFRLTITMLQPHALDKSNSNL